MKITGFESEAAILKEIGQRIKSQRIALRYTQAQLAEKCGLSEGTIKRIENGKGFHITQLLKLMDIFGIAGNLDILIPAPEADYEAIYKKTPTRQRVRQKKEKETPQWRWGDESGEQT